MSDKINRSQAKKIIRYLKRGVFPPERIEHFTVGRNKELKEVKNALSEVLNAKSRHFFFEANYGVGKSHLLKAVESLALRNNFAVSRVVIDGYEHAFNHPARYLHCIFENLCAPGIPNKGLYELVSYWLKTDQRKSLLNCAKSSAPWDISYSILNIVAKNNLDYHKRILESRDIQHKSGRNTYSLIFNRLDFLSKLCRSVGLNGIIFLFDEVETIATLLTNIRSRLLSYELLNKFTNSRCFPYCCFFFAITPDLSYKMQDDKYNYVDFYENEYHDGYLFTKKYLNNIINVISLGKITNPNNEVLCRKLRKLHEFAYSWSVDDKITDLFIEAFVDEAVKYSLVEREIIKSFINILEICNQHSYFQPSNFIDANLGEKKCISTSNLTSVDKSSDLKRGHPLKGRSREKNGVRSMVDPCSKLIRVKSRLSPSFRTIPRNF